MSALIIPVVGVAAYLALSDDDKAAMKSGAGSGVLVAPGSGTPSTAGLNLRTVATVKSTLNLSSKLGTVNAYVSPGAGRYQSTGATTAAAALSEAEKMAKAKYAAASAAAKAAGAAALSKQLGINPPLTGKEDWATMAKRAGAVAGAAACGVIPGGAIAIPLCSIVGAYFGEKLSDWLAGKWGTITDEVKDYYDDAKDAVTDVAGDVYDEISSWF